MMVKPHNSLYKCPAETVKLPILSPGSDDFHMQLMLRRKTVPFGEQEGKKGRGEK